MGPAEHKQYRSSRVNVQIFKSVSRNVLEEWGVLLLETFRGQSASAGTSWVLAIGR